MSMVYKKVNTDAVESKRARRYYEHLASECRFAASVCEETQRGELYLDLNREDAKFKRITELCRLLAEEFGSPDYGDN